MNIEKKKFRRAKRKEKERRKKSINGLSQRKLNKKIRNIVLYECALILNLFEF